MNFNLKVNATEHPTDEINKLTESSKTVEFHKHSFDEKHITDICNDEFCKEILDDKSENLFREYLYSHKDQPGVSDLNSYQSSKPIPKFIDESCAGFSKIKFPDIISKEYEKYFTNIDFLHPKVVKIFAAEKNIYTLEQLEEKFYELITDTHLKCAFRQSTKKQKGEILHAFIAAALNPILNISTRGYRSSFWPVYGGGACFWGRSDLSKVKHDIIASSYLLKGFRATCPSDVEILLDAKFPKYPRIMMEMKKGSIDIWKNQRHIVANLLKSGKFAVISEFIIENDNLLDDEFNMLIDALKLGYTKISTLKIIAPMDKFKFKAISEILEICQVQSLELSYTKEVGLEGVHAITTAPNKLQSFALIGATTMDERRKFLHELVKYKIPNGIEIDVIRSLSHVLCKKEFHHLNLYFSTMGKDGAKELSKYLAKSSLKSLSIARASLGSVGASAIFRSLPSTIEKIDMNFCAIGFHGLETFLDVISNGRLPNLKVINFNENMFGDKGLNMLTDYLENGKLDNLTELEVEFVEAGITTRRRFLKYAKTRFKIRSKGKIQDANLLKL